jgi:hypothetical protein
MISATADRDTPGLPKSREQQTVYRKGLWDKKGAADRSGKLPACRLGKRGTLAVCP